MPQTPTLVIFGASGDLTRRLLFPALYRLAARGRLPDLRVLGTSLEDWSDGAFRDHLRENLRRFAGEEVSEEAWGNLAGRVRYLQGDLGADAMSRLAGEIAGGPALFYLALPPGLFAEAAEGLAAAGLEEESDGWRRLVIEKPFGTDLESARALNARLASGWREDQIYRIDHFLGKESVQNLLVFRFANRFLEPVLNAAHVDHVQITVAEDLGLEGRAGYYDEIGALRDMIQNHLMQLLTYTAMEPPTRWDADLLRSHKVEVLEGIRAIPEAEVQAHAARGQYTSGTVGGEKVPGYREEDGIDDGSTTETFAAVRLEVDGWRWAGVPFYMRTGKRMTRTLSEVVIAFKEPPTSFFRETALAGPEPGRFLFRLKPEESLTLTALSKEPGLVMEARQVELRAPYRAQGEVEASAYEQLVLDALEGDRAPFLHIEEVEWAWRILEPVLQAWKKGEPETYPAGSRGPEGQDRVLRPGHRWRPVE